MKKLKARAKPGEPGLLEFTVDGEVIENVRCLPGVRNGKQTIEATAKIVIQKKEENGSENTAGSKTDIHSKNKRKPRSAAKGTDKNSLPAAERGGEETVKEGGISDLER